MAQVLVIDDDASVRRSFSRLFARMGHDVRTADNLASGTSEARKGVDVICLDLDLPDGNGLGAIDTLSAATGHPEVIVITGMGSLYGARQCLQSNAWDYIPKPASPQIIKETLTSALRYRKQSREKMAAGAGFDRAGIVGEDPSLLRTLQNLEKAAGSEASVVISGETGVGKELAARAVHTNSRRGKGPFVVVDCSNMTDTLIESMLYGHAKGAFTGAHADRAGLVAAADDGVLFLDEIGELPLHLQKAFLRVLQERCYRPVGSGKERTSDFRLIAATHRDLSKMVREKTFRSDLLFRLRTVEIVVPPLRDRKGDKALLAMHFIGQYCERYGIAPKQASGELGAVVHGYRWPGNVRELSGAMEAAVVNAGADPVIYPKHLPDSIRLGYLTDQSAICQEPDPLLFPANRPKGDPARKILPYGEHKSMQDHMYFTRLMEAAGDDIGRASHLSGLSIPSVYRRMAAAGIPTRNAKGLKTKTRGAGLET